MHSSLLMLVNRSHPIPRDFYPPGLVKARDHCPAWIALDSPEIRADCVALGAFVRMLEEAKAQGVGGFLLVSGYRSYERQAELFARKRALDPTYGEDPRKPVAVAHPNASEHRTGLALDIASLCHPQLEETFATTPQGAYLYENAARFGFVLRYPKGKEHITGVVFEPWHFRYVGEHIAAQMQRLGLEEFLDQ